MRIKISEINIFDWIYISMLFVGSACGLIIFITKQVTSSFLMAYCIACLSSLPFIFVIPLLENLFNKYAKGL